MERFAQGTAALAAISARTLGWTPATFWAATPEDLAVMLGPADGAIVPPSRAEIAALIEKDGHDG